MNNTKILKMINYKKEKEDENEMSQEDNVTEKIPLYPNKEYLEEDSFFSKKSLRQIRKARSELNIQDDIFIIVKETHRIYGGAEEGGWWYDQSWITETVRMNPQDCPKYPFWKLILNTVRRLKKEYPQPRFNRFSAAGNKDFDISLHYCEFDIPEEETEVQKYE